MEKELALSLVKSEDLTRFLSRIEPPELYVELRELLRENDGDDLCELRLGGETIGLISADACGDQGYVYVYVFPEFRGRGCGAAAVSFAERQIRSPELKTILTSYCAQDEAARRFAAKCGFAKKYGSANMVYRGGRFALEELPVRPYEDGDYPQAFPLAAEAFHKMRLETGCFPESVPGEPSEENRKSWAAGADERYVYVVDGEIVGYAHLDGAEISSVSVRIDRQGRGYGRNFVKYLVNLILEGEEGPPSLWCLTENRKARRLYDSLGFEEVFREDFAVKPVSK